MALRRQSTVHPFHIYQSHKRQSTISTFGSQSQPNLNSRIDRLCLDGVLELKVADTVCSKMIWGFLLSVALAMGVYQCVLAIDTYRKSPIMTTTQIIVEEEVPFPDIYVCPMNVIDKNKVANDEYIASARKFLSAGQVKGNAKTILNRMIQNSDVINTLAALPSFFVKKRPPDKAEPLFQEIAYKASQFILECSFNQRADSCDQSMFIERFDIDYGRCYLLPGKNFNQTSAGHGLTIVLDIHRDLYDSTFKPMMDGVRIFASYGFDPTMDKTSTGVFAAPGQMTDIALSATQYRLINVNTGLVQQLCQVDDRSKKFKYSNLPYSMTACRKECQQIVAVSACGCLLPIDNRDLAIGYGQKDVCTINTTVECFYQDAEKRYKQNISQCINDRCRTPCTSWDIDYRSSSLPLNDQFGEMDFYEGQAGDVNWNFENNPEFINVENQEVFTESTTTITDRPGMKTTTVKGTTGPTISQRPSAIAPAPMKTDPKRLSKDMVIARMAFSDLRYYQITQTESMTFDTFIANIGGQLGLWIGASIISVFQIVFLIFEACHHHLILRRKRRDSIIPPERAPPAKQVLYINDVRMH